MRALRASLLAAALLAAAGVVSAAPLATAQPSPSGPALSHRLALPGLAADSPLERATLTLHRSGDGSVTGGDGAIECGPGCPTATATFLPGTAVTLTAQPGPEAAVTWDGCMRVEGDICFVTMTGPPVDVIATFDAPEPAVLAPNCRPRDVLVDEFVTCLPVLRGTFTSAEWVAQTGQPTRGQSLASFTTVFASPGVHTISLTACNDGACSTATESITVLPRGYAGTLTADGLDGATVAAGDIIDLCYALTPASPFDVQIWTAGLSPDIMVWAAPDDGTGACTSIHIPPGVSGQFTYRAEFRVGGVLAAQDMTSFTVE